MKSRPITIGLIIVVAALAGRATRIGAMVAAANGDIAALAEKLAATQREAANRPAAPTNESPAKSNDVLYTRTSNPPDPQAMLAEVALLPPGPGRNSAMQSALGILAVSDPQKAWDMAQDLPDDGSDYRLPIMQKILARWSATDPVKAATLLATLSTEEDSDSATNTTGVIEANWLKQDPVAASQWINTLPTGNTRDSAIMALALGSADADMPTAFNWVTTMADPSKRGNTVNKVVTQWATADPVAARNAVLAQYTNNNNGRQATLLAIIARAAPDLPLNPNAASVSAPAP
jgi:hypothetical protein